MEFPNFKEIPYSKKKLFNINDKDFISESPTFIDLKDFSSEEVDKVIEDLTKFFKQQKMVPGVPYPLFLVTCHAFEKQSKWPFLARNHDFLPAYFRREVYLKNSDQIKLLRKFDIFISGLHLQKISDKHHRLQGLSEIFSELKEQKVVNSKLESILKSFT